MLGLAKSILVCGNKQSLVEGAKFKNRYFGRGNLPAVTKYDLRRVLVRYN